MTTFDLYTADYLALVTAADLGLDTSIPGVPTLAVYAPGLICAEVSGHQDAAATLHFGFLAPISRESGDRIRGFLGRTCFESRGKSMSLQRWQTALENRQPLTAVEIPLDWRRTTQRRYWKVVPALALVLQVEPQKGFLHAYLRRMTTKKQALSAKQEAVVQAMLRERGAFRQRGWSQAAEQRAHLQVIRRRRDLAFRLGRLAALDLKPEDAEIVVSLRKQNVAWRSRRRWGSLTESQEGLIRCLEARYRDERAEAARALAERLVGE
jgi:hypothetical protein